MPVQPDVEERYVATIYLRPFLNVADEGDYRLLVTWLLAALRPCGPYPILVLHGEQGAAKSKRPSAREPTSSR